MRERPLLEKHEKWPRSHFLFCHARLAFTRKVTELRAVSGAGEGPSLVSELIQNEDWMRVHVRDGNNPYPPLVLFAKACPER